ncbi:MAG: hypothetical protein ACXVH2_08125 [Methanobacterium sp.]
MTVGSSTAVVIYQTQINLFSRVLAYYRINGSLPGTMPVQPWYKYKIDVIVAGTGGYVNNNIIIASYLPQTEETSKIFKTAVSGTPMITFSDGSGPKVMVVAGVHGNELPAQIAAINLINYLNNNPFRGTVYIIPFVIPSSSAVYPRYWNGMNLNSVVNVPGTPTNQILNLAIQLNVML